MDASIKNEWLAELLINQRDLITENWIEDIRAEGIKGYQFITDEQLRQELPLTVDAMIRALQTGDTEGARRHSFIAIQRRLVTGFELPDLQMSLHALETAVMRIVKKADVGQVKELEALQSASNMYYMVALIAATVYEQLRTEQQKRFITAYEFGLTLSRNLDLNAILDFAVGKVAEYTNEKSVAILLANPEGRRDEVRAYHNFDPVLVKALPGVCESIGCNAVDADSQDARKTGIIPDVRSSERLSRWSGLLGSHGCLSLIYAPLIAKQIRLGTLVVLWPEVYNASNTEIDFLFALASHVANAVHNAMLYEEARGKRELGVLLKASKLFASSLDTQDILRKIARMATEAVKADLAIVFVRNHLHEGARNIAYYAGCSRARNAVRRILEVVNPEAEGNGFSSLGLDFSDGNPILFSSYNDSPGKFQALAGIIGSGLVVPLRQKDSLLGAFALISLDQNAYTEDDLLLATGLADLATVAIENARSYEHERNIAETLQRSFLPSTLPGIEGYETAAYYRPAKAEAGVGGDFYDVFITGQDKVGIVIGDVSGKGLTAAVPTAMGKYMIRAYAAENASPDNVLATFNRTFYENVTEGLFMTALYGILNPRGNIFTYVSAGHNPPLLYSSASGQVTEIRTAGLCLGIVPETEYVNSSILLQPGDALLLYTDGATDVKEDGNGERLEIEGLQQLFLSAAQGSAEQIVHSVSDAISGFSSGKLADDVALVVIKRV